VDEGLIRLGFFFGVLVLIGAWEVVAPRRRRSRPILSRWASNFGLVFFNTALLRLIFPTALVGVSLYFERTGVGLFHAFSLALWLELMFTLVILDFAIYWQHKLFHAVPWLWRVHRTHHTDIDFDLSTGVRFHPIEIVLSMCFKVLVIALLGAAPLAVMLFEIVLSASALFSHGNILIPRRLDALLRFVLVTPDMHRIHHSVEKIETDSNYGFCLSCWDRLFLTYREEPQGAHDEMGLGLNEYRANKWQSFWSLLRLPFVRSD